MRAKLSSFHDAEIRGLFYDPERNELTFRCCLVDGTTQSLTFLGVKAWRLSEFQDQNVVSALDELNGEAWRNSDEGREVYYQDVVSVIEGNDVVYRLESSTGVEGVIVATSCRLERVDVSGRIDVGSLHQQCS